MLRVGDPHNLHFSFFSSKTKMNLLMSWFKSDFYFCNCNKFLKSYFFIAIWIEEIENRLGVYFLNIMLWLYESKIVNKIWKWCFSIFISVVSVFPKGFKVAVADFCCVTQHDKCYEDSDFDEAWYFFHNGHLIW